MTSFTWRLVSCCGACAVLASGLACDGKAKVEAPAVVAAPGGGHAAPEAAAEQPQGPIHRTADAATMVAIPASSFMMGNDKDNYPSDYFYPWAENEIPAHMVTLAAFSIDRDEATVTDYAAFLTAEGGDTHFHPLQPIQWEGQGLATTFRPAPGFERMPMNFVTWYDAATYCAWAGKRLPTEAEWERAARGPANTIRPWGSAAPDCTQANALAMNNSCETSPVAVGSHPAGNTAEGVHDMVGNVEEWVYDAMGRYTADPVSNPTGPVPGPSNPYRVIRGGGFHDTIKELSGTSRWGADPSERSEGLGIRCAL